MSEIKSTLDLIMEKTKNLSLSQQERQEIRRKELQSKVNGWTQRYLDDHIDTATLQQHLTNAKEDRAAVLGYFKKAMLAHIDPNGNNKRIFRFLQEITGEDIGPLSQRIESFKAEWERNKDRYTKDALDELAEKGIRGTAVIPHLDQYPPWQIWRSAALDAFKQGLN